MDNIQPFFILSNPRSGSSLLRVICDSHPEITVPPECGFTEWWHEKYKDWKSIDNQTRRLNSFCGDLASSRKFETWNFDFSYFKNLVKAYKPENYADLVALVHVAFGLEKGKKIKAWGDKNNYFINKTDLLNQLFPEAKFIFIVRDGRDVATSYISLKNLKTESPYAPKLPSEINEIALEWNRNNSKVTSFLSGLKESNILILRYEDLVNRLEENCKMICKFLNVPFNPQMLEYYKIGLEPMQTLDWKKKTLRSPDKLAIGKYKKLLTSEEIDLFNSIAGKTLKEFGYEVL